MRRPRLIPVLLIDRNDLIKTINFNDVTYLGDPINAIKIFNEKEVDELCVIDRTASEQGIDYKMLREIADEAFMPLSYGGGIKDADEAVNILKIGFEKIIINEHNYVSFDLVQEIAKRVGSQSVIVSIDYKTKVLKKRMCVYRQAKVMTKIDPLTHALDAVKHGAGELLITSVAHEGVMKGFDYEYLKVIADAVDVPVIAHGGAGTLADVQKAIYEYGASAVAVGSMFVYYGKKKGILINYPELEELMQEGVYR